ncbi:MAG TPA: hypothetical protein VKR24_14205 [Candidatus Limnocylindrales bacterium]|nr:hypothetical protein [Candidatus Limnocylindrales bacterium]
MSVARGLDTDATRRSIERELDLVLVAIRMVAGGGAPGVTLVGLEFATSVLEGARPFATEAGVLLEPLWQPDDARCDIRVARRPEDSDAG